MELTELVLPPSEPCMSNEWMTRFFALRVRFVVWGDFGFMECSSDRVVPESEFNGRRDIADRLGASALLRPIRSIYEVIAATYRTLAFALSLGYLTI